ncbi:putative undecaprenyl-phosphate N-acetylglucosaminyl 1-phosphate transferase [subsurface metagenome]
MWVRLIVVLLMALVCSLLLTPLVRRVALRFRIIERPNPRKIHKRAVTCLGGVAIYTSFVASVLVGFLILFKNPHSSFSYKLVGLLCGGSMVLVLGLVDDIKGAQAPVKVSWQIAAALVTSAVFGIRMTYVDVPFFGVIWLGTFSVPLTLLWVVGLTNALNWIDGLDGLAAGISSIACVSLLVVSWRGGDLFSVVVLIALLGATLGFLKYNFYPAKVFMGDTGSNFLGFVLANVAIMGGLKSAAALSLMVPILILGIPIFDTLFSVWRRVCLKKSPIRPDTDHFHFRLVKLGLNHRQAVLVIYIISAVLGGCAILLAQNPTLTSLAVVVFIVGLLVLAFLRLGLLSVSFRE